MKRTILAMMMAGSGVALFAQTNPLPTTPAPPSTVPATAPPVNNNVTNSTSDPVKTVTNGQPNTYTGSTAYPPSTSWDAGTPPSWGWNSYGVWNNDAAVKSGSVDYNTSANSGSAVNATGTTMAKTPGESYSAYAGTAVNSLPYNVQTNFTRDYPNPDTRQYAWNQYGDWFGTYYTNKGRLTQYLYDQRGNGYSLSLPVIQTYVPEEIVDKALQKYGAHLYSISMVKTADGSNAFQVGLIDRGRLHSDYLSEGGATVSTIWRTEEVNLSSTASNAAMNEANGSAAAQANGGVNTEAGAYQDTTGNGMHKHKTKTRTMNSDSTTTITKNKHGKMKTKTKGHRNSTDSTMNPSGMKEQ